MISPKIEFPLVSENPVHASICIIKRGAEVRKLFVKFEAGFPRSFTGTSHASLARISLLQSFVQNFRLPCTAR